MTELWIPKNEAEMIRLQSLVANAIETDPRMSAIAQSLRAFGSSRSEQLFFNVFLSIVIASPVMAEIVAAARE